MFTLGRKIDLGYKTNQIIVLSVFVVTGFGWLLSGEILTGINLGIGVFLTWALARELDPVHEYSAFLAAALSLFMLLHYETVQILVGLWLLLLMRAVNGITGKELTLFDIFSVLGLTVFLSLNNNNNIYLLIFVLAMLLIRRTGEKIKAVTIAGALGVILFISQNFFMNPLTLNGIDYLNPLTLLLILASSLSPIIFYYLSHTEIEDDKGNKANSSKISAGQLLYSIAILLFVFFGEMSFNDQIIYLAATLGVIFYFIGIKFVGAK